MTKKIAWILLSFLMAVVLVLASCGGAAEEEEEAPVTPTVEEEEPAVVTPTVEEEEEEVVLPTGPEMVYDTLGNLVEAPQYGGTVYLSIAAWMMEHITPAKEAEAGPIMEFVYEWMHQVDWAKGPAGTGESDYSGYQIGREFFTGGLAESWELPDEYTMIYHIRPGVRFQNKQPAWGREYTAADFVSIAEWNFQTPWSPLYVDPATPMEDRTRVELIDDMTVIITYTWTTPERPHVYEWNWQAAPEILWHEDAEGELPWENDWRYMCGTGPFMVEDYVEDSAVTFVRNDLYWMHDPLHLDNQLPYVDRIVGLDIPDIAVYHSALQTGKLDVGTLDWLKAETFKRQVPEMLWAPGAASRSRVLFFMADKEPFNDIRVRQALTLAFNNQKLLDEYWGGNALLNGWPSQPGTEAFIALEDMPADLQKFYIWSPENNEEAKALLADAGFPNGFKTETYTCWQIQEEVMSLVADDWAKIGVELELIAIDGASWGGHLWNKSSPAMIWVPWENASSTACVWLHGGCFPPAAPCFGNVIDPIAEEVLSRWSSMWSPDDQEERAALLREEYLREIMLCWTMYTPTPYPLVFWWPWVKNFHGISHMARSTLLGSKIVYKYVWIDQDLKYQMTGTRD